MAAKMTELSTSVNTNKLAELDINLKKGTAYAGIMFKPQHAFTHYYLSIVHCDQLNVPTDFYTDYTVHTC